MKLSQNLMRYRANDIVFYKYYSTDIITINTDSIIIDTKGWYHSVLTKKTINKIGRPFFYILKGILFVGNRTLRFFDGIRFVCPNFVLYDQLQFDDIPPNFNKWDKRLGDYVAAEIYIRYRRLPRTFKQWGIRTLSGDTIAHLAARYRRLPRDFNQWHLTNNDGWTVAHEAARSGCLPPYFDQWNLQDKNGVCVAKVAKECGHLPESFDKHILLI